MKTTHALAASLVALMPFIPALAQQAATPSYTSLVVYPTKGQSAEQLTKDKGECQVWSQTTTGIDPAALAQQAAVQPAPAAAAPAQPAPTGARARGAVRGAAAGAVIGEIASNDAGKGAAIGATAGVVAGGARQRQANATQATQQQQTQQQAEQQQAAQQAKLQEDMALYTKGYTACLEGRGYTVK